MTVHRRATQALTDLQLTEGKWAQAHITDQEALCSWDHFCWGQTGAVDGCHGPGQHKSRGLHYLAG